jgi:hypothetical protein
MPNIIEQQDLLKGLPDTKIAMLLQNPVGTIPPFLVAAEAQRRQAIRQQFAGPAQNESVVDTLTKQIANVPQNIQSGQMATPPVPPTPQMQGVMALQQQQAMQQTAQPQQAMRSGGPVQRYADGSMVQRMASRFANRAPTVQELATMTPEQLQAYRTAQQSKLTPEQERLRNQTQITGGRYGQGLQWQTEIAGAPIFGAFSEFFSPESVVDAAKKLQQFPTPEQMQTTLDTGKVPTADKSLSSVENAQDIAAQMRRLPKPRSETAGQDDTSVENQSAGEAAELRKKLEELYGDTGLSDWEKAQKWFAASQQFLEPDQTLMQSLVGAASAFAGGAAQERAAEREARLAGQKGLLEWDIARYEADQKARADIARDELAYKRELQKMQMLSPGNAIEGYNAQIKALENRLENVTDEKERQEINTRLSGLYEMIATIMRGAGYGPKGPASVAEMQAAVGQ